MKKTITLLVAVALASVAVAKPVDAARARRLVEERFFSPALLVSPTAWNEIYVFAPADGNGFVVVSADDCTRPVLAYSYSQPFRCDAMPTNVAGWLEGYRREIAALRDAGATATAEVAAMWLTTGRKTAEDSLPPLLTTTWNQRPLYNLLCPWSEEDSARAVAGCVATAQAQVMKYWNHPAQGHGSYAYYHPQFGVLSADFDTTYMWDIMPDALTSLSSDEEIYAVAHLSYHVGVAVRMNYGVSGSGASVYAYNIANYPSSETSLKNYFGYNPMLYRVQKTDYTDSQWDSIMLNELQHGRPVLYTGRDSAGGHAFVIDGYSSLSDSNTGNRFFHINWGWGGHNDGYYTLDSLSPGSGGAGGNATYTFNMDNGALVGIEPSYPSEDGMATVSLYADPQQGTIEGNGEYTPYSDPITVVARANNNSRFVGWKGGSNCNPLMFTPYGDLTDTAIFEPVKGDTVGYCFDELFQSWRDDYGNTTEWGIRLLPEVRNHGRSLSAVQMYIYQPSTFTVSVYFGDSINADNLVYTTTEAIDSYYEWYTLNLDQPLQVGEHDTVWITVSETSEGNYPGTHSRYSGNSDGSWYHLPEGWVQYDQEGEYMSWMLRGIFVERPVTVDVVTGLTEEDMAEAGVSISGAGTYNVGETVTLTVNPGICFAWGWGTPDQQPYNQTNPLVFTATGDTTLSVWFNYFIGIDDVEQPLPDVTVLGRTVMSDCELQIYDITGRLVGRGRKLTVPCAGVYMLRVDGGTHKLVIK